MDACHGHAEDPMWRDFCVSVLTLAKRLGARVSANQTKQLLEVPGALQLPRYLAQDRFLTPYFRKLLV